MIAHRLAGAVARDAAYRWPESRRSPGVRTTLSRLAVSPLKLVARRRYLTFEALAVLSRTDLFDRDFYAERHPEVRLRGIDPVLHYVLSGATQGRDPHPLFDTSFYLEQ